MKQPLLIDMDGVLRLGNNPAPGVPEFFKYLENSDRKVCILSNSTLADSSGFVNFFKNNFIDCIIPILTTVEGTLKYVQDNYEKIEIYCSENVKHLFREFIDNESPQAIIVGDIGRDWNFEILNDIFKKVLAGADLIAMQKNKFWSTPEEGLLLDAGSFIKAIEHAAGKEALLIGKPSPLYFQNALEFIGLNRDEKFLMLGDDLETDILGAKKLNSTGILIYTGKTNKEMVKSSNVKPEFEVHNLFDVIELLQKIN
jgi:HAD superfamily hydrolase (TIGR01458 family)